MGYNSYPKIDLTLDLLEIPVSLIIDFLVFHLKINTPLTTVVIDRYGNSHLTDTDMFIITDADTDKKKTNSPIPIPI